MRNSWVPRVVTLVVLSAFFSTDSSASVCKPYPYSKGSSLTTPTSISPSTTGSPSPNNGTNLSVEGADFNKCPPPSIVFAPNLDNRRETAFAPGNQTSYPHGSAQNIDIISQFECDTLTNSCDANQAAKNLCKRAQIAASNTLPVKTGIQADAFNAFFDEKTNFATVQALDDQGNPINNGNSTSGSDQPPKNSTALTATTSGTSSPNFGTCTTPEIKFAVGLDGRKETAFAPNDPVSYPHGSADNIGVISSFICLSLTNTCKANDAAKTLCTQAQNAGNGATPPQQGVQADAFNKVFGINTNFAAVQPISNTGQPVNPP